MPYTASCHCGQTAFEFEGDIQQALACNCSICQRRGSLLWLAPRTSLRLLKPLQDATYQFHKHKITHHFCPTCGIHTFGEGTAPDGTAMAAINLRCVENIDLNAIPVRHHDGRAM